MNSFMSQSTDSYNFGGGSGSSMSPSFNNGNSGNEQRLTIEQTLQLMNQVAASVKQNDFSSQLANNIYLLCQQLKNHGQALEQNHKNDLNKCFIALRQACCRDSGQLGTPCRLKMMELVELRAMGWRPNLAHTQYYLNRPEQPPPVSHPRIPEQTQSPIYNPAGAASHSPFNHQFSIPPPTPPQQQPLFLPQDLGSPGIQVPPGYFFIPNNWQNQLLHHNANAGLLGAATTSQQHLVDAATAAQWAATRNAAAAAAAAAALMGSNNMVKTNAALGLKTPRLIGNMALNNLTNSITNPKSNKSAQLREEVTIRNCDSGKIMGVKGRRVAVVEELSKTVISFQKVDPKSKDRVLTITGSTEDSIQFAKKLIEETIRRNVSPNRFQDSTTTPTTPPQISSTTSPSTATTPSQSATTTTSTSATTAAVAAVFGNSTETDDDEDDEDEDDAPGISIETGKDGTLKLCCDDPDVLQAAQAALSEYLNRARRSNRMSAEERAEKKERRKSMPLQSTQQKEEPPPPPLKETRRAFTGSTPNLAASLIEGLAIGPKLPATSQQSAPPPSTQYSREKLLEIREQIEPSEIPSSVLKDANPEVIAELAKPSSSTTLSSTTPSTTTTTPTTNGSTSNASTPAPKTPST